MHLLQDLIAACHPRHLRPRRTRHPGSLVPPCRRPRTRGFHDGLLSLRDGDPGHRHAAPLTAYSRGYIWKLRPLSPRRGKISGLRGEEDRKLHAALERQKHCSGSPDKLLRAPVRGARRPPLSTRPRPETSKTASILGEGVTCSKRTSSLSPLSDSLRIAMLCHR